MRSHLPFLAAWLLAAGIALSHHAGLPVSGEVRTGGALAFLLLLPGYRAATMIAPSLGVTFRIALGFGLAHGWLAALAVICHLTGLSLGSFLVAAILVSAGTFLLPARSGGALSEWKDLVLIALCWIVLLSVQSPRNGFWTDVYDHIGTVRWMQERNQAYPREAFHADRMDELDPRKGTAHSLFAAATRLSGVDPLDGWSSLGAAQLLVLLSAIHALARSIFPRPGTAWIGFMLFALLFRGGPGGEWFRSAAYPGIAGYSLFLLVAALGVRTATRGETGRAAVPVLLGLAAGGIHIFYGTLAGGALVTLFIGMLFAPGLRPNSHHLRKLLALFLIGAAPLFLFRMIASYDPANPLHLHRQGMLLLPFGLSILDHRTLAGTFGLAGGVAFLLLPFLKPADRPFSAGELFLLATSIATVLVVLNPLLFPLLERKLGYLMRRVPSFSLGPFVLLAVMAGPFQSGRRLRTVAPAALAALAALFSIGSSVAEASRGNRLPMGTVEDQQVIERAVDLLGESLPVGSTVVTDPVTGYALFGRTLLHPAAVVDQHSSPNDPDGASRVADTQRLFRDRCSELEMGEILEELGADFVVVNMLFPCGFRSFNAYVLPELFDSAATRMDRLPLLLEPIASPEGLRVYRVRDESLSRPEPAHDLSRDPLFEPLGPILDREMEGGTLLVAGRVGVEVLRAGELMELVTWWSLPEQDAGPLPMSLFVRARPADGSGQAGRPWSISVLGGLEYPYVIWRANDRVVDRHSIRVPARVKPGRYLIEVTLDPARFFPVSRISGLRRGAIRSGWTVIDTLEIRS